MNSVNAICKRCGKPAPSDKFVLDPDVKLMICPACVTELRKPTKPKSSVENKPVVGSNPIMAARPSAAARSSGGSKPADWDEEDEYLERMNGQQKQGSAQNQVQTPSYPKVDEERIKYTCKCGYSFTYNTFKEYPKICPYCKKVVSLG